MAKNNTLKKSSNNIWYNENPNLKIQYDYTSRCANNLPTVLKVITCPIANRFEIGYKFGNKDPWAVFKKYYGQDCYGQEIEKENLPKDKEYFDFMKKMNDKYKSTGKFSDENFPVLKDFALIFNQTGQNVDNDILGRKIDELSQKYDLENKDQILMNVLFSVIYLAMVSEYHYVGTKKDGSPMPTKFKKELKMIGVYQTIIEEQTGKDAATWSKINPTQIHNKYEKIREDLEKKGIKIQSAEAIEK